jgi:nitrate/TMAO reductase-like tetraheme cytochrome c subunit
VEPKATQTKRAPVPVKMSQRQDQLKDFPCSKCHEGLEPVKDDLPATHRTVDFRHFGDGEKTVCKSCHKVDSMDELRLQDGTALSFDDSVEVCAQCHATVFRDWDTGAHGKQVGSWQSGRVRYVCTDCHDPHSPRFGQMETVAAPPFPELGIRKGAHHE